MGIGMTRVQHVKIPVSDLGRSAGWYATLLDLAPFREFVEHGALRGAALRSPEAGIVFALRERQFCASQPNLAGFDLIALRMASREALADLAARCDRLAIEHSPVQDRGPDEAVVDVPDPDGTVLRFFWEREAEQALGFMGLCFGIAGPPESYDVPRLPIPVHEQTGQAAGQLVTEGAGLAPPGHSPGPEYRCMHAVVATVRIEDLETARRALAALRLNVVPRAPGFVSACWLASADGIGMSVIVFETKEHAEAATGYPLAPLPGVTPLTAEIREVVASA
jgi:Glyoxalase/Bleomycin resistance protein/Dioxygenase superfamily